MTKLPFLRPRQVVRALERAGFTLRKSKSGHRTYIKGSLRVTVPYHSTDIKPGTSALHHRTGGNDCRRVPRLPLRLRRLIFPEQMIEPEVREFLLNGVGAQARVQVLEVNLVEQLILVEAGEDERLLAGLRVDVAL